jgi:hypothetical protein
MAVGSHSTRIVGLAALVFGIAACSLTAPIQPVSTSKSPFDSAPYKGTTVQVAAGTPGNEAYRVFNDGAIGFVSLQTVRDHAVQRARDFCSRKGKAMESLTETTSMPPYILNNYPKIEIVFECVTKPQLANHPGSDSPHP